MFGEKKRHTGCEEQDEDNGAPELGQQQSEGLSIALWFEPDGHRGGPPLFGLG